MPTFHDGTQLAAAQKARAAALKSKVRTEHAAMVNTLFEEGQQLLSGKVSAKAQRAMGGPYGRGKTKSGKPGRQRTVKGTKTRLPAMPINTQSGRLRESLRVTRRQDAKGQTYSMAIGKSLRYARYILSPSGTGRMVTRPYFAQQQKSWKRQNFDLLVRIREAQRKP